MVVTSSFAFAFNFATPLYKSNQSSFLPLSHAPFHRAISTCPAMLQRRRPVILCKAQSDQAISKPDSEMQTRNIPVHHTIPIISTLHSLVTRTLPTWKNGKRYGDIYEMKLRGQSRVILTDFDLITKAYKNPELFSSRDSSVPMFVKLFGKKLMVAVDGEEHRMRRAKMQTAFSPKIFSLYFERISMGAHQLWDCVAEQLETRDSIKLSGFIKKHFLRNIISITTGKQLSSDFMSDPDIEPLIRNFLQLTDAFLWPSWTPQCKAAFKARDRLLTTLKSIVQDRIKNNADVIEELRNAGDRLVTVAKKNINLGNINIITVAIAASTNLSSSKIELNEAELEDLSKVLVSLWFAGYSTQSSATLSCLLAMHLREDIKDLLSTEQEALIASAGSRAVTFDQVMKEMPLLDSYISEILRLHPPATILSRKLLADAKISGCNIKKGSIITFDIRSAQRDPKYYEQPNEIKIDRFLNQKNPLTHEILSFGASGGPHFCVGAYLARMNMKATLSTLLRNYDLAIDSSQSLKHLMMPELQPASGVKIVSCSKKKIARETP